MRVIRRLARLSRSEYWSLLEAGLWVTAIRLSLWVCPFKVVWHWTRKATQRRKLDSPTDRDRASRGAWAVRVVSRYVPQATCLTQALAVYAILRRAGIDCELRLGVTKAAE